jgi:O-antigen ligase
LRRFPFHVDKLFRDAFSPETGPTGERLAFGMLLVFILAVPALGGGAWPGQVTFVVCFALLLAAAALATRPSGRPLKSAWISVGAALSIAVLGILQVVPFPDRLLSVLSPVSSLIYHETAQILSGFGKPPIPARISIAPSETAAVIRLVLADVALFYAATRLLCTRARRRLTVYVFVLGAAAHVTIAAALQPDLGARVQGSFGNPNHFAAFLEMALALAFAALWTEVLVNPERRVSASGAAERVEDRLLPVAARILLWAVIAIGIALTQSRAGVAAAGVTTVMLLVLAVTHPRIRRHRQAAVRSALALLAALMLAAIVAGASALTRFLAADPLDAGSEPRFEIWRISLEAWKQFPVFGSGLGTFGEAFRRAQPRGLNGVIEYAHSDPLQLLVTGGAVGAALALVAVVSFAWLLLRLWRSQRHREESAVALGALGALLTLGLHGMVDYNMSIPAVAASLAVVLGLGWTAGVADTSAQRPSQRK